VKKPVQRKKRLRVRKRAIASFCKKSAEIKAKVKQKKREKYADELTKKLKKSLEKSNG